MADFEIKYVDGVYKCDFRYLDVRIRRSADTEAELKRDVKQRMRVIDLKVGNPELYAQVYCKLTFNDVFEQMIERSTLGTATIRNYKSINNNNFKYLANKKITEITNTELDHVYREVLEKYKSGQFAPTHTNKVIRLMKDVMSYAMDLDLRNKNIKLALFPLVKNPTIRSEVKQEKFISQDNFKIFLEQIYYMDDSFFRKITKETFLTMTIFLFYTGVRIAECRGVTVDDIKFKNDKRYFYIDVNKQIADDTNEIKDHLKNGLEFRQVPIHKELYDYLRDYIHYRGLKGRDYLFKGDGDLPITRKSFSHLLKRVIAELRIANLIPEEITTSMSPQGFRISNVRLLFESGIKAPEAARYLGHSVDVMNNIYMPWSDGETVENYSI